MTYTIENISQITSASISGAQSPSQFFELFTQYRLGRFFVTKDGLYVNQEKKRVKFTNTFAEVRAVGCNGLKEQWTLILSFSSLDGDLFTKCIPFSHLSSDFSAIMAELNDQGFMLQSAHSNDRSYFKEYLTQASNSHETPRVLLINKMGFFLVDPMDPQGGYGFILPHFTLFAKGVEPIDTLFMPQVQSSTHQAYKTGGDLKSYLATLAKVKNNVLFVFDYCLGLASLLRELGESENFGIHTYGQSSTGKSTGGQIAMSVVGCCADSQQFDKATLRQSWVSTSNGIEAAAAASSGHLLFLDELGAMSAGESVGIYALLQGQGKTRMTQYGGLKNKLTWNILVLSTGEVSMRECIEKEPYRQIKEGEMIRILDIPVDDLTWETDLIEEERQQLVSELKSFLSENYGVVGQAYIEAILDTFPTMAELKANFKIRIEECYDVLCEDLQSLRPSLSPLHKRAIKHFALIWAAGLLAIEAEVSPFSNEDINLAVTDVARAWLAKFPLKEEEQLLLDIKDFLQSQCSRIVDTQTREQSEFTASKPGILLHKEKIWLSDSVFTLFCDHNLGYVAKLLCKTGVLYRAKGNDQYKTKLTVWSDVFGRGSRYYALHVTKLFSVEEWEMLKEQIPKRQEQTPKRRSTR